MATWSRLQATLRICTKFVFFGNYSRDIGIYKYLAKAVMRYRWCCLITGVQCGVSDNTSPMESTTQLIALITCVLARIGEVSVSEVAPWCG